MEDEKSKLIIVEGPQGTGKTTLTNYLRDNMPGSNLYRLSGQKDKSANGRDYSVLMYSAGLMNYLDVMQNVKMDLIFDRTFITEEVYARLGYKDYSFTEVYKRLLERLVELDYDIYYFSLFLKQISLFEKRLQRDSHHNYQAFSLENSLNQQNTYIEVSDELKEYDRINVYDIAMDDFDESYEKIGKILKLKR